MNTGLLWYEANEKKTVQEVVAEAALYFRRKFGRAPEFCLVNPKALTEKSLSVEAPEHMTILVKPYRAVLPKHFWIGFEQDDSQNPKPESEPL